MLNTEEWWHRMFELHVKLIEDFDTNSFQEFKQGLDSIPYVYAKPYVGLGIGSRFIRSIANWFDDASRWSVKMEDYDNGVNYLERALDYYCDPTLDYSDEIIENAKERMSDLVSNCIVGIYLGSHEIGLE